MAGLRHAAEDLGLSRLAVMSSSFSPFLNTTGVGMRDDKPEFNFGFIDAANFGLREEMHLGR
jgi:hypothetical protein